MKRLTVPKTHKIQINQARNLYLRNWEKSEIEFRYHGELEKDLHDDLLSVSCKSNLLVSIPENVNVIVEKIEGNCNVFGEIGNIVIDKVNGNLQIESLHSARVCSIGGNCKIGYVGLSLEIEKIGGNCYVNRAHGKLKFDKINGNFHGNGENIQIECKVGGNLHLQTNSFSGRDNKISAGGNIKLNISGTDDISLIGSSGGSYSVEIGVEQLKGKMGKFKKIIGTGQKDVILSAGGKLQISDQEKMDVSNIEFFGENEKLWNELETEVDQFLSDLDSIDFPDLNDINSKLEKLSMISEFSESSGFDIDFAKTMNTASPSKETDPKSEIQKNENPVSEEEKMIVLKMLQDKKITAEEADRLLQALEQ